MITVRLNNQIYNNFLSVNVNIDLENLSSEYIFSSSLINGYFPVSRGEKCDILVDGVQVLKGYVEKIKSFYSTRGGNFTHTITISGRDRSADIGDSRIDASVNFNTPITLENIIKNTLSSIGFTDYKLINEVGQLDPFQKDELVCGHIGQGAFSFINEFCAKRQVLLTNVGNGDLLITRGEGIKSDGRLLAVKGGTQNNILESEVDYNDSKRFYKYILKSQPNKVALSETGFEIPASQIASIQGVAVDSGIRTSRLFVMNSTSLCNTPDSLDRAEWERNIRQARAIRYEATVFGHSIIGTNQIWKPRLLVNVYDEVNQVIDTLIIRKVMYSIDNEHGDICRLDLVPRETFILDAEKATKQKKKKKKGSFFTESQINEILYPK